MGVSRLFSGRFLPSSPGNLRIPQEKSNAKFPQYAWPQIIALAAITLFYAVTLRQGTFWADDYALYVHHAENIAKGRAYADTGYIYNPAVADYSPRAYPPVFPLLLTPVYRGFGLSFYAMKFEIVGFFVLTLLVVAAYWERALDWPYMLALLCILGFSPIFWAFKDSVVADIPFLFFFYLAAWVGQIAPREGSSWWKWALVSGSLLYLCTGTRTVGLAVVAGLLLYEVIHYKKLTRFFVLSLTVCTMLLVTQRLVFGAGEQSYADQLHPTLASVLANIRVYPHDFTALWTRSLGQIFSLALFALTTVLACYGFVGHSRKSGLTLIEAFLLPYLGIVILWPSKQGIRFLLPLIPFYAYLLVLGLQELPSYTALKWMKMAPAILLLMIGVSYIAAFRRASYGTIRQTNGSPAFKQLCRFIQDHTNKNDIFVFRRCRALSLFTSRPAALYDLKHQDQLATYFTNIHANYIVASPIFEEDREVLFPFIRSHSRLLNEVYRNDDFQVYQILDSATASQSTSATPPVSVHNN